jgi:hypothetical protein
MSWDVTPRQVRRETRRWLSTVFYVTGALLGLIIVVTIVLWHLHAWMFTQNVKLQNNVYQNSYGTQQSDISSMASAEQQITGAFTNAQVRADVDEACSYGVKVNDLPPAQATWFGQNCSGAAISPTSPYYNQQ